MASSKLLKHLTFLIFFILIVNYLAIEFYWYFTIRWFDMPMHFLGGAWLGLASVWVLRIKELTVKTFLSVLGSVLAIGVAWEVYEIIVNNNFAQNPFDLPDTLSDIFFDLFGGSVAILYVLKRIMPTSGNAV